MRARNRLLLLLLLLVLPLAGAARAEAPSPPRAGDDPIAARLFPPELIMVHQQELAIDDKQRVAILREVEKTQSAMLPIQWQMQGATGELARLLDDAKLDEGKVLAQAEKVMDLERQVKRSHLALLVRLRNLLTDAQRAKLKALR
ncbi:MAG: Heavy-metal resistance protein [Myxococcales bacterium]|nr:Heavy-metal resistance protein [Myxococcales bacterium]